MIIVGVDYHPSVQQVAFLDTETGLRRTPTVSISCEIAAPPRAILARAAYTAGRSPF